MKNKNLGVMFKMLENNTNIVLVIANTYSPKLWINFN